MKFREWFLILRHPNMDSMSARKRKETRHSFGRDWHDVFNGTFGRFSSLADEFLAHKCGVSRFLGS